MTNDSAKYAASVAITRSDAYARCAPIPAAAPPAVAAAVDVRALLAGVARAARGGAGLLVLAAMLAGMIGIAIGFLRISLLKDLGKNDEVLPAAKAMIVAGDGAVECLQTMQQAVKGFFGRLAQQLGDILPLLPEMRQAEGRPLVTDNGQQILDVRGLTIADPLAFESAVKGCIRPLTVNSKKSRVPTSVVRQYLPIGCA